MRAGESVAWCVLWLLGLLATGYWALAGLDGFLLISWAVAALGVLLLAIYGARRWLVAAVDVAGVASLVLVWAGLTAGSAPGPVFVVVTAAIAVSNAGLHFTHRTRMITDRAVAVQGVMRIAGTGVAAAVVAAAVVLVPRLTAGLVTLRWEDSLDANQPGLVSLAALAFLVVGTGLTFLRYAATRSTKEEN